MINKMRYNAIGRGIFKKTDIYLLSTRVAMITVREKCI